MLVRVTTLNGARSVAAVGVRVTLTTRVLCPSGWPGEQPLKKEVITITTFEFMVRNRK